MLGVELEVVERLTRFINVSFIKVCDFSRRQSCILRIVHPEGCVSLRIMCTMHALPLVNLRTLIFETSI
jgi:hypothetical protein